MDARPTALPSLDFLLSCSKTTLASFEIAALNRAANLLKAARVSWEQAAAEKEAAGVARWLLEYRESILDEVRRTINAETGQPVLDFPKSG